ncbi:MAG: hypothetical protein JWR87_1932, partial [Segetibacter sp.]|nr:hypothetical protein [Segetibacter sp.]
MHKFTRCLQFFMNTLESQKEHFKTWFNKTNNEQSEIRQGLVGQEIVG